MNKQIELSVEKARELYGKNPQMDELLLANFTNYELTKKELPKYFSELKLSKGYYITSQGKIDQSMSFGLFINTFATEKQALSALAMAQLSQLMAVYNDDWEPNWNDESIKYIIERKNNNLIKTSYYHCHYFLAFKKTEIRSEFLKNFEPLIRQYFMMD